MTTEAGQRLLGMRRPGIPHWDDGIDWPQAIAAIEAEARDETIKTLLAYAGNPDPRLPYAVLSSVLGRVEQVIVAAERERIAAAVEGLFYGMAGIGDPSMTPLAEAMSAIREYRVAVLAIVREEKP
jgi:hypothetical protein